MHVASLLKKMKALDARIKASEPSDTKELQNIRSEIDEISANLANNKEHHEYQYLLFEMCAKLEYIGGNYDEAERFCNEAIRLHGEEYPDAKWLRRMISKERLREWDISSKESELKNLRNEKSKIEGGLAFAAIGLLVFAILFIGSNSSSNRKSKMIDTCVSDISDANDVIGSMNDSFDEISSDASNASGSDYGDQASALDDISSKASDAKQNAPSADCSQVVSEDNSSSN